MTLLSRTLVAALDLTLRSPPPTCTRRLGLWVRINLSRSQPPRIFSPPLQHAKLESATAILLETGAFRCHARRVPLALLYEKKSSYSSVTTAAAASATDRTTQTALSAAAEAPPVLTRKPTPLPGALRLPGAWENPVPLGFPSSPSIPSAANKQCALPRKLFSAAKPKRGYEK